MKNRIIFLFPYTSGMDGSLYIARCEHLNLYGTGQTAAEANDNLRRDVTLYLESALSIGTLPAIMEEIGFKPGDAEEGQPMVRVLDKPPETTDEMLYVDIPIHLLFSRGNARVSA